MPAKPRACPNSLPCSLDSRNSAASSKVSKLMLCRSNQRAFLSWFLLSLCKSRRTISIKRKIYHVAIAVSNMAVGLIKTSHNKHRTHHVDFDWQLHERTNQKAKNIQCHRQFINEVDWCAVFKTVSKTMRISTSPLWIGSTNCVSWCLQVLLLVSTHKRFAIYRPAFALFSLSSIFKSITWHRSCVKGFTSNKWQRFVHDYTFLGSFLHDADI